MNLVDEIWVEREINSLSDFGDFDYFFFFFPYLTRVVKITLDLSTVQINTDHSVYSLNKWIKLFFFKWRRWAE